LKKLQLGVDDIKRLDILIQPHVNVDNDDQDEEKEEQLLNKKILLEYAKCKRYIDT
jgi:hypothetical protein